MKKLLMTSAFAMILALSVSPADAKGKKFPKVAPVKMSMADCNAKCTAETGKKGNVKEMTACFNGCPGSENGDVAVAAAETHHCKEDHDKPVCQIALKLAGKWMLDIANDKNENGEELRALIAKTDAADSTPGDAAAPPAEEAAPAA